MLVGFSQLDVPYTPLSQSNSSDDSVGFPYGRLNESPSATSSPRRPGTNTSPDSTTMLLSSSSSHSIISQQIFVQDDSDSISSPRRRGRKPTLERQDSVFESVDTVHSREPLSEQGIIHSIHSNIPLLVVDDVSAQDQRNNESKKLEDCESWLLDDDSTLLHSCSSCPSVCTTATSTPVLPDSSALLNLELTLKCIPYQVFFISHLFIHFSFLFCY